MKEMIRNKRFRIYAGDYRVYNSNVPPSVWYSLIFLSGFFIGFYL